MAASGFAGLGYQVVWTQQCALWLGHETAGVLAVVAAFFGGLAFGARALGRRIERSRRPRLWYVGCELTIAVWALALTGLMAPFGDLIVHLTGVPASPLRQWSLAFAGTAVLLLPATAAMGATMPAMARVTAQLRERGWSIAPLYASNTAGAVLGALATAFWLVPTLGLRHTALISAALNLGCALAALRLLPRDETAVDPRLPPARPAARQTLALLFMTGLLGIGYEVLVVRVLSQVAEDTVYTFAMMLAVYLVGTAIGAALLARGPRRGLRLPARADLLLAMLSAACLLGALSLWGAEIIGTQARAALGASMAAAIASEALLALIAFAPATILMGALFSSLSTHAMQTGIGLSRALAVNTLGAACAPLAFGVLAFPLLGAKGSLLLLSLGYLVLVPRRQWRTGWVALPAAALLLTLLLAPRLAFIEVPEGGRVLSYEEGIAAAVSVVEDAEGIKRLRIDNRQQEGTSATQRVDGRQAVLPLLLHPQPQRVLFLGLGTGVTATTAAQDPRLHVDAVELLPEVIEASHWFDAVDSSGSPMPRPRIIAADARRYVRASTQPYDVIISDNFHPARSGSGALYTVEHFNAVRARLAGNGLFCQWLPLHQLDLDSLRSIVRSFLSAFPDGVAVLANNSLDTPVFGLIGRMSPEPFDMARLRERLAESDSARLAARVGVDDELAVLGSIVAGSSALAAFSAAAPANTDDRPVVAYRAPRITYAPDSLPRDRLVSLLQMLPTTPVESVLATQDARALQRLAAYWSARNRFIEIGRAVRPSSDVHQMLAQVEQPLLEVLRLSPDFRPAYDPLLAMAHALANDDVPATRELLMKLATLQPERTDASVLLREIETPAQ